MAVLDLSNFAIVLGVISGAASIVALLISAPGKRSKLTHVIYALILTVTTAYAVQYHDQVEQTRRIEKQAQELLNSADRSTEGSMKGFMLAVLSFLEKNKQRFPDTYTRATKVAEGAGLYERDPPDRVAMDHFEGLQEGSGAMYYLLKGIAAPTMSK